MSRNMIEANIKVFSIIRNFIEERGELSHCLTSGIRFIKTNAEEKKWLKKIKIEKTYSLSTVRFATFVFENNDYFVAIGWKDTIEFDNVFEQVGMNGGLFTALVSELSISLKKDSNPLQICDEVLFSSKESIDDYNGHDYLDLEKFFEPILFFKIAEGSPHKSKSIHNLIGYFLCKNHNNLFLKFTNESIIEFEKIFIESSLSLPYENLISCLASVHWKYSFLDEYRCLELLFPFLKIDELHQQLNIKTPLYQFASELENVLNWKAKEDKAIEDIISRSPKPCKDLLRNAVESIYENRNGNLGSCFYKVRNSIVHFRPATEKFEISDDAWAKLIEATIKIIRHWYSIFEPKLASAMPNL